MAGKPRKTGEKHGRASPSETLIGTNTIPFIFPNKSFHIFISEPEEHYEETPRAKDPISPMSCSHSSNAL